MRDQEKLREQWRAANARRRDGTQLPMAEYRAKIAAEASDRKARHRLEIEAAAADRAEKRRRAKIARPKPVRTGKQREQQKAWRKANPGRMLELKRAWKKANPEKVRADKRGRHGKSNERRRTALMKVQKGKCGYCREKLVPGKIHIDHVMPRALGGSNRRANLQLLCEACNLAKGATHPITYAQYIGKLL